MFNQNLYQMKNQFSLEIKQPCSENFNQFTPTKNGGFCDSCSKEVVDFTGKSPEEIMNYFQQKSGKNTCGQFTRNQLATTYTAPTKKYNFFKGLAFACLSLFTFNTVTAQTTPAQEEAKTQKQQETMTVKGVVSDEGGFLPGVNVHLQGTEIGTETDFDGNFVFPQKLKKGDVLIFSFVGLETQKIVIGNKKDLSIKMKSGGVMLLGKVAVKEVYKSNKKF